MTFGLSGAAIAGIAAAGVGAYSATKTAGAARDAANTAANGQVQAAQLGIDQQNKQFEAIQKLLAPFVTAGTGALAGQQDLLGLNGAGAQSSAISALQTSPQYRALSQAGQDAILANASATGGLRGGNVQSSLAQFQPALLSQIIQQQLGNLGGITSIGQNAAAGVGNAGLSTGNQITSLLGQQGSAQAGAALAGGRADAFGASGLTNSFLSGLGVYKGLGGALTPAATAAPVLSGATPEMIGAGQF